MKITYLINEYPKVSHSFIRREILALERTGMEVQRVSLRGWSGPLPDEDDIRERGRTRYVLKGGLWPLITAAVGRLILSPLALLRALRLAIDMTHDSDRSLAYHIGYLAEACRILPWLRAYGTEHVHAHFGTNSAEVAMLVRALGGPPFSFTVHGPEEFMRHVGLRRKVRHSSFVVTVSSFGRSQLCLCTEYVDWSKIHVVHCGLDASFHESVSPAPPGGTRLVCVGRLTDAKAQLLLVEAAARLAATGTRFELVLAGDGPQRPQIEALIERHGLQGHVRITGWISSTQVRAELLAARAMILPSFAEGLPVVIMEAMALRRPVLTTYIAGIPELVVNGETGWLFPAGSIDHLTAAIQDCLSSTPERLERMGAAGYLRAIARHSIDTEAIKLAALLRGAPHRESDRVR